MRKHLLILFGLLALLAGNVSFGQVTTNGGSGLALSYPDLNTAITALNAATISGPVVITLAGNETAPAGGYVITASGSSTNAITIQGSSSTITASAALTAGSLSDAIFKLVGADYVTITGFSLQENVANTTTATATNNMTEWGIALMQGSATDGAQNNTIQTNTISLDRTYANSIAIYSNSRHASTDPLTLADITNNTTAPNSGNKVYGNTISNVNVGIAFIGSATGANADAGNDVGGSSAATGNTVTNYGNAVLASAFQGVPSFVLGIGMVNQTSYNVSYNSLTSAALNTSAGVRGVLTDYSALPSGTITNTISNNTITFSQAGSGSIQAIASQSTAGAVSGITQTINANNVIGNAITGAATSAAFTGIINTAAFGVVNLNNNIIRSNTSTATTGGFIGISNTGSVSTSVSIQNNQLGNSSGGVMSFSAATSGTVVGISNSAAANTASVNISGNTLQGFSFVSAGAFTGISQTGTPGGTVSINNNNLGSAATGIASYSAANSTAWIGIVSSGVVAAGTTVNMQNNDFRGLTFGVASSSAVTFISISGLTAAGTTHNITGNTFTNLNVNTTGTTIFISQTYTATATSVKNTNNNSIVTAFNRGGASGLTNFIIDNGSSVSGCISNCQNNNFSNITITGTSTITGISYTDGGTAPTRTVSGNTISNVTAGSGTLNLMNFTYWNGTSSLTGNTVSNVTGTGAITGLTLGSAVNTATLATISANTITGLSSTGTGGNVTGITCANTSPVINISGNTISSLSSTGASSTVLGIAVTGATTTNVFGNTINTLSVSGATSPLVRGISVSGGSTVNVYKNKIYDLTATAAIATTAGAVNGVLISGGATVNVFNNLMGDLKTPAANLADAIRGINITSTTASTSYNVYYNTIWMNATSTGTNFGTSGIFHTISTTATTARLDLRNNIISNTSTPNGTGLTVAFRRSAGAASNLANYAATSNNNLFYAGTPSASRLIYSDGTSSAQTMANYQSGIFTAGTIAPRDAASFSSNPPFLSTTATSPDFLHIDPAVATLIEGGATVIASITDDYDGNTRNTVTPDVGADEYTGITPAPVLTSITRTPSAPQCSATARTITVNVSSPTGVTGVTLNYNNGAVGSAAMTLTSGTTLNGTWTGTIPAASPVNATVTWSVTATDGTYNTSATGSAYKDAYLLTATTTATALPSTVCAGVPSTLSVSTIDGAAGFVSVGTQTTTIGGNDGNPYRSGNGAGNQIRIQLLYTASELSALGLAAGPITSIGLTTTSTTGTLANFSISMKHTTQTATTTSFDNSGFTTVFTQATFTPAAGLNTHTFSTPFVWDGVSNILVNFCQTNSVSGTSTVTAYTPATATNLNSAGTTTGCTAATGTIVAAKPILTFGGIVGVNFSSTMTYTWNPGSQTGATISVTPGSTTTYTATGVDGNGCSVTSNAATVTVNPLPAAPSATASTQCGPGVPAASVTSLAGASGNGTFLWYSAASGGTLLQGPALAGTLSTYYNNDFSSATLTNSSLSGAAAIGSGVLTLHSATTNQQGGLTVNASGVNSTMYQTTFDLSLTSAGTTMADGFSYSFADDAVATTTSPTAEHGSGSKLRIGFFTFNTASGSDGKGIYLMYGVTATTGYTATTPGVLAYSTDVSWLPTTATTQTTPVTVSINTAGQLTLTVGATTIFNNVQLPAAYLTANRSTWKHVFASRSGGTAGGFGMDNLIIQANAVIPGYTTYQSSISNTTTFHVSEVGTNGCESARTPVLATVNTPDAVTASTTTTTACQNTVVTLTATQTGTTNNYTYLWSASPSAGSGIPGSPLTGASVSVTPTLPGTYIYTVSANDATLLCNTSSTVTVTVSPQPLNLVATASQSAICAGDSVNLSASSGASSAPSVVLNENFNGATNNWTTTNLTTSGTPAATAWTVQASPFTTSAGWNEVLSSPGVSQFYVTNSDAGGSGNNTHTILQSPAINTVGLQSLNLDFFHYFKYWSNADSIKVEVSTDGTNWSLVQDLAQTTPAMVQNQAIGTPSSFAAASIPLNSYVGNPTLYIRFRYRAVWGYGWAIDSVRVSGAVNDAIAWSSSPAGYTASGASQTAVKPTSSTVYIATATNSYGCTDTAQAAVTVNSPSVAASASAGTTCANAPFNLTANLLLNDFNGATNNWTTSNSSTGGTPANAAWTLTSSPYLYGTATFNSNDASQFYLSNSDAQGSGGNTNTILRSPAVSTVGMTSLNLEFYQYFRAISGDSARVEVSTDGNNWSMAQAFTTTQGAPGAFSPVSINLNSYVGNPRLYVRFRYTAAYGWYWAIDNVKLNGSSTNTFAWSSVPAGFTSGSQNPTGVTALDTTIYTVTVTDGNSCTASSSVTVNVQDQISGNTIGATQTICSGSTPAQLTGGLPTGGSGTYVYLWQSSTTSATSGFTTASGTSNGVNYSPAVLTATTWYRRVISSGTCADTSAAVDIVVTPGISNNTINSSQSICSGTTPAALTGSAPSGAGGTYTYVWLSSNTSATSGFSAASGANTNSNYSPAALTANTWYKRVANSGTCSDTSAAILISVAQPLTGNTISSSQTICAGSIPAPLTGSITGLDEDLNGLTSTAVLTTALLPSGWGVSLNQGNLATGFNTNSYARPAPNGAIRANNYNVGSGNIARIETKAFGPSVSGDSLRFDVAYVGYDDAFGDYVDTLRIYANTGSGYNLLKQYITGLVLDTSENGITTGNFISTSFSAPTASQWTKKKLALPAGTTNVRFEFASGFGNMMYVDRIQADSAMFTWLSSTTSATAGYAPASGTNNRSGYAPAALTQTTWYRRVATAGGPCAADTSAPVLINVAAPIAGNTISAAQSICAGSTPAPLTGGITGLDEDMNGLTSTAALTTALLPSGWGVSLNQGNLATGFNTNSYARPAPNGAIRANNYNVGSGNIARIETKTFGPSVSGDSLRFDVAYVGYDDAFGDYIDTLRIYANTGSGYNLLKQYITGLVLDTSENGITTGNFISTSFSAPTASQWTKKKLALPAGTTNVRFEFASGFGNMMYVDRIQADSAIFTWLSSTTSATAGYAPATGTNNNVGYAPGALTQTTWYRRVASAGTVCGADTSAAVQITVNTPASITSQPASTVNICATNTIMLSVAANNAAGYQWYKGTTALSNTGNTTGATAANLRIANAAVADGGAYRVVVSGAGGCNDSSAVSTVTVTSLGTSLAANNATNTYVHSDGIANTYTDASCNPILKIVDGAGGNTLGSVQATVNVTGTVQTAPNGQKYLQRYYNVTPTSNGAATVTLFALQSEFTAYNNAPGAYPSMPTTGSSSDPNIGNIRVTKYSGSPFTGGGNALLINPTSVVWNGTAGWWEITFPVTTFSSFYIHTGTVGPLDITLNRISATNVGSRNRVDWVTETETNADHFEVERSADGANFSYLGTVKARGEASTYSFWDEQPFEGVNYYRLKMSDKSGEFTYSQTVSAVVKVNGAFIVEAFPNPVTDKLTVRVNGRISDNAYIILTDMAGKLVTQQKVEDSETTLDMTGVAQGVYFMKYIDDKHSQTIKVNKK